MRPQDVNDLYLAPIALGLDARLRELGELSPAELDLRIALSGGAAGASAADRRDGLLDAITEFVDLHHWTVGFEQRGLLLQHQEYRLVLGLPATLQQYLAAP